MQTDAEGRKEGRNVREDMRACNLPVSGTTVQRARFMYLEFSNIFFCKIQFNVSFSHTVIVVLLYK